MNVNTIVIRDPYSKNDRNDRYDRDSRYDNARNNHIRSHSRSRSPGRSKSRNFYDSSQRNHSQTQNYSTQVPQAKHNQQRNFNRNDDHGYNSMSSNSGYNNGHHPSDRKSGHQSYNDRNNAHNGGHEGGKLVSFNPGQPSRTVMLRQLPYELDDAQMRAEFNMQSVPFKDLRLVKNHDSGQSRGFAFVEFNTIEECQRWMTVTQGCLMFPNYDNKVQMFYSNAKEDQSDQRVATDWDCAQCGIKNFKRRDKCFKCGITREDSELRLGGEGYNHVGITPCDTLILRGLDPLTHEEALISIINTRTNYCLVVKNCFLARDPFTRVSRGFVFIEMNTSTEAGSLIDVLGDKFEIDNKQIMMNYSKNTFNAALTQLEIENRMNIPSESKPSNKSYSQDGYDRRSNQADAANSAAAVAQAAMQNMHKKQELINLVTNHLKHEADPSLNPQLYTGSAILYDNTPNKKPDVDSTVGPNLKILAKQVDLMSKIYPTPDPSQFVYDETSGFYYDYSTTFYYDPKSTYYFNSVTHQYMYWDAIKSNYIPVDQSGQVVSESVAEKVKSELELKKEEPVVKTKSAPVVKTAAQIAKDMENWAKSQNTKKTSLVIRKPVTKQQPIQVKLKSAFEAVEQIEAVPTERTEPEKRSPTNGKSERSPTKARIDEDLIDNLKPAEPPTEPPIENTDAAENSNEADAASENSNTASESAAADQLIDTAKLACLLCKRQFDSLEILNKHIAKSDLHKKNLEKYKLEKGKGEDEESDDESESDQGESASSLTAALKYRDRANERRAKYGQPDLPKSVIKAEARKRENKKRHLNVPSNEHAESQSLNVPSLIENTGSVASKLMRKMGWNEGSGIGKNLQGISAPIEATMRQKGAGLGSAEASYDMDPNDAYSVAVRKSARARYDRI